MKKPSLGLIIFSSVGILLGLGLAYLCRSSFNAIRISYWRHSSATHISDWWWWLPFLGVIYITVNIAILFLYNWARKTILVISWLYIGLNITSFLIGFPYRGQACIGLFILSPLLLYSIIAVIYLTMREVKERFIQKAY